MKPTPPIACCNVTSPVQGQEGLWDVKRGSIIGDAGWVSKPQQAFATPRDVSAAQQSLSGETRRGRPPVPDPTGTEDSPLSQVLPPASRQCLPLLKSIHALQLWGIARQQQRSLILSC